VGRRVTEDDRLLDVGFELQLRFTLASYGVLLLIRTVSRDVIDPVATIVGHY